MEWLRKEWLRWAAHVGSLAPLALMLWDSARDQLGFNPIQELTTRTGKAALVLLVLSLAVTPLMWLGAKRLFPLRRILGLYAFGYVALHLLVFSVLDYELDWTLIMEAIAEKRFILAGFASFLLLLPLALTSTRWAMRRLGKRWKPLHRLVYVAAPLAVLHYIWLVKADTREPLLYGAILALLLALRLPFFRQRLTTACNPDPQTRRVRPEG
jgi:methionine sulfoxide reductase heme-binding subunit